MIKTDEATDPNSCWNKARRDERVFIVLARDAAAPETLRFWANKRIELGKNQPGDPQIESALELADRMAEEVGRINAQAVAAEHNDESPDDLIADLSAAVAAWVKREAVRLRDGDTDIAEIKIRLAQPQSEDDGTLYLEYTVDETTSTDRGGNLVPGVSFERSR